MYTEPQKTIKTWERDILYNMKCFICNRDESEAGLVDVICDREIQRVCEECVISENLPVVQRPSGSQISESQRPRTVRERLSRMAGVPFKSTASQDTGNPAITLDSLRKPRDYNAILAKKPDLKKRENETAGLVDNFNWHVQMARRARKLSLTQLGSLIGEPELGLRMIEQGVLPDNGMRVIAKLEQFFKIKLGKTEVEREKARLEKVKSPARVLSFDPESLKSITLADLKKMRDAKEQDDWEQARSVAWRGRKREEKKKEEKIDDSVVGSEIEILDD